MSSFSLNDVMSVKTFVDHFPDLGKTEAAIRWDIYNSKHNGLDAYSGSAPKGTPHMDCCASISRLAV